MKPKYIIVEDTTKDRIEYWVQESMKKGYIPVGGVSMVFDNSCHAIVYAQAMILKENKK